MVHSQCRHISLPKIWSRAAWNWKKNLCETRKWNSEFHRKISNGKTGLPFQKFIFQWNESKTHVPFPTQLKFPESLKLVNGKRTQYTDVSTKVVSRKGKSVRDKMQCRLASWLVRVRGSRWFSNKEREKTNTCLCCFPPPRWNTLRFTQATVKTTLTHNNFQHYPVSFSPFVRQPFSKQLYLLIFFRKRYKRTNKRNHA